MQTRVLNTPLHSLFNLCTHTGSEISPIGSGARIFGTKLMMLFSEEEEPLIN